MTGNCENENKKQENRKTEKPDDLDIVKTELKNRNTERPNSLQEYFPWQQ